MFLELDYLRTILISMNKSFPRTPCCFGRFFCYFYEEVVNFMGLTPEKFLDNCKNSTLRSVMSSLFL